MGNKTKCKLVSVATIRFRIFDGIVHRLIDVLHVAGQKKDLISIMALHHMGYKFLTRNYYIKVFRSSFYVMKVLTTLYIYGLYVL